MQFFANGLTGTYLRNVLPGSDVQVEWVKAAIAYGDDEHSLLEDCLRNRRRLDIWMRYDHTVPVAPSLLRRLLRSADRNVFCRLVPDVLHSKVIWWRGYGVYVGSANLTDRAWVSNIEFGVFLTESQLEATGALGEIEHFFEELTACDATFDLSEAIIAEQEAILKARDALVDEMEKQLIRKRSVPRWGGPTFLSDKKAAVDRQKEAFIKEWREGAAILQDIALRAPKYKPAWLNSDVPPAWQADQFLHAYYYNRVVEGTSHPYEDSHRRNFANPASATEEALVWWSQLPSPPSEEDVNCHERAPLIKELLAPSRIGSLDLGDFSALFESNHSSRDHYRRMTAEQLRVDADSLPARQRSEAFAKLMWGQRNRRGQSVAELIAFVLDGGSAADMPSRLFDASRSADLQFPHLGRNQLAELAGWARPEKYSPRNGRTSKALRALGHSVRVY
ncbi:MAG TPA: phospholipase D-like domain-containing protein [Frateuria sp.]|uniref:phospholipase D-like domain-containing protein n=1 Tax=Frateuria sp. TaxID=2211372 RepID=UPI002D7FD94D|nr:phospholipase D-like domain-containing protein [Frateuria sp.]HET6806376.1 phospholipase D-like domain-containing protein [Frateuria sp.]